MNLFEPDIAPLPPVNHRDEKDVYALFGLVFYLFNCFEVGLPGFFALWSQKALASGGVTLDETEFVRKVRKAIAKFDSLPTGGAVKELRKYVDIPKDALSQIENTIERRNYLAHKFFREHSYAFTITEGRKNMVKILQESHLLHQEAEKTVCSLKSQAAEVLNLDVKEWSRIFAEEKKSLTRAYEDRGETSQN